MRAKLLDPVRVDRTALQITSLAKAERADQERWRSRTPDERLAASELICQVAYGYDPSARRLSRFYGC